MVERTNQEIYWIWFRIILYAWGCTLAVSYVVLVSQEIFKYGRCFYRKDLCEVNGYRTDFDHTTQAKSYINKYHKDIPEGNLQFGNLVTNLIIHCLFLISGTVSIIVVWLIDLRSKTNGFTRVIQYMSAGQIVMDYGFFMCAAAMTSGFYRMVDLGEKKNNSVYAAFYIGQFFLVFGDNVSLFYTNVMSYIFYKLSKDEPNTIVDVNSILKQSSIIIIILSIVISILQNLLCKYPFDEDSCDIVITRGAICTASVTANFIFGFISHIEVNKIVNVKRQSAIKSLISRTWFYVIWVAFSRFGYMVLSIGTGSLNLNFYEKGHEKFMNLMSTWTYCLWLPTGMGFGIYYLYTHPDEWFYFIDVIKRKPNAFVFADDIRDYGSEIWNNITNGRLGLGCCESNGEGKSDKPLHKSDNEAKMNNPASGSGSGSGVERTSINFNHNNSKSSIGSVYRQSTSNHSAMSGPQAEDSLMDDFEDSIQERREEPNNL
jgi:hypothetical protein